MGKDAIASRRGTDSSTASSPTASTGHIETIPKTDLSGVVGRVIPLATPDRSLQLSADEIANLFRIGCLRDKGFMVSAPDVDFLLKLLRRLMP
jgi:hypothetical protein